MVSVQPPPPRLRPLAPRDWRLPRLDQDDAMIGGVAGGTAAELGVPTAWIRLAFVILFALGGWGAFVYGVLWVSLSWARSAQIADIRSEPIGLRGRTNQQRKVAVAMITAGLALASGPLMPLSAEVGFAMGFMIVGFGLAWRTSSANRSTLSGQKRIRQLLGGVALVVGGSSMLLFHLSSGSTGSFVVGAAFIGLIGTIVVSAPWISGVLKDFDAERSARVRSEERAEVAAHLHDSVLQTLLLIQKADDPKVAKNLARRQERELRNWLDPNRASRLGGSIRGQLDQMASDVEELHGVPVEVIAVGDALIDKPITSLLKAAAEAARNAARHSGTERIDVFVEVRDEEVELYVRDTGKGFDPATVAQDRRGVAESIIGRMDRAGGTAVINSAPGEGTEVELRLPRQPTEKDDR